MAMLDWMGKNKIVNHHNEVKYRTLNRIYSFDEEGKHREDNGSENMIIHGDNLEALKSLLPKYEGRIKCIYIDPPYNTGNENWVYNDNVNDPRLKKWLGQVVGREGEDLSRHDKWLCMMYPRLKLLQSLLSDDGAIFISIDDNEQANLKLICDEIFGQRNFVQNIVWDKRVSPARDAKFFSTDHEYILVYAKDISTLKTNYLPRSEKNNSYYKNPDNDPRGPWNSAAYTCNKSRVERPNLYYGITNPTTGETIYPKESAVWAYSYETHLEHVKNDILYWGVDGKAKQPRKKAYLTEVGKIVPRSVWQHSDVGSTQRATLENNDIFGERAFSYPKAVGVIERILQIASNENDIVLDSFAGSATTAHAVLNMNKADGGNRKFILIEMMNYAEGITAERVKRVIKGYGEGNKVVDGTGGTFSYYELGSCIFNEDGNLSGDITLDDLRKYVYYSETKGKEPETSKNNKYYLGTHGKVDYYLYYDIDGSTTLNYEFLATIKEKQEAYVIYADRCIISEEELLNNNITFKKIPRDVIKI